jgi:LmbE family N-acetylglucosaminyl deacetylase
MNFEEGQLEKHSAAARLKVRSILEAEGPDEVFIPHAREPLLWSSDHLATYRIVYSELQKIRKKPVIWEYPIWYWFHWPWIGIGFQQWEHGKIVLKNTLSYYGGLSAVFDFNFCVSIKEALDQKREALRQHKSQVTRLIPDNRWTTLYDMARGDFVRFFFRDYELFRRTQL